MPQSPSKVGWDLTQFSQSPSDALSYFPESHQWSEISSLSKVVLLLGKARSCRAPNLGCSGAESSGWFDVLLKHSAQDVTYKQTCCRDEAANHQLPNNFCEGTLKLNAKFDADFLLYLVSYFECNGHTVHVLTQWPLPPPLTSIVNSSLFIHAHSSPLSLAARLHWCYTNHSHYINNGWTFSRQTSYVWPGT